MGGSGQDPGEAGLENPPLRGSNSQLAFEILPPSSYTQYEENWRIKKMNTPRTLFAFRFLLTAVFVFTFLPACDSGGSGGDVGGGTSLTDTSGTATVTEVMDTDDNLNLGIKASFPANGTIDVDVNSPIVLFMNDKVLSPSLTDNYTLTAGGASKAVSLSISADAQGNAILVFKPDDALPVNSVVEFMLSGLVQDDGGLSIGVDFPLTFTTAASADSPPFTGNGGFESGSTGIRFIGDGAVLTGVQGNVFPPEGNSFAAITTGGMLVSAGSAVNNTTSTLIAGPVSPAFTNLAFKADFASSEFNDFVGTEYDDTALVVIYGPQGVKSFTITSVNITGSEGNTGVTGFAGLPDNGDEYAGHTGWKDYTVSGISVGTPAYVVFVVSDVGDLGLSSVLAVDAITFQ